MGAIKKAIQNAFIRRALTKALEGNTGSNIIGAVLVAIVASNVNYMDAFEGFRFEDMNKAMESAKLVGAVGLGFFTWFVGRKEAKAKKDN